MLDLNLKMGYYLTDWLYASLGPGMSVYYATDLGEVYIQDWGRFSSYDIHTELYFSIAAGYEHLNDAGRGFRVELGRKQSATYLSVVFLF